MEQKIELSVIVPAYNMERYLGRCLDSILKQGVKAMEIIVVDAGSTDGTREIIEEYAQKHTEIVPIYSNENLWASAARNKALDIAQGEYIAFCDADDTAPKGAYQEMLRVIRRYDADIVTGNYMHRYGDQIRNSMIYSKAIAVDRCFEKCNLACWNKLFRRKFVRDIRFAEDVRTGEDALYCMTIYRMHPTVAYTNTNVYVYTLEKEEDEENEKHKQMYPSVDSFNDCLTVVNRIFTEPFEKWDDLWARLYVDYTGFLFNHFWFHLKNPNEKRAAFEKLQDTMKKLQKSNPVCDYSENGLEDVFFKKFHMDFVTFCSFTYDQYLFALLLIKPQTRHTPSTAESFVNLCRHGQVGMRTILRCIKGWLAYKLKKQSKAN